MATSSPGLLYHAHSPVLYPTNDPAQSLLTVRFAAPVRVSSVRLTPEGVSCPSGIGATWPSRWTGKIYLNVSPSDPVNALAHSELEYDGGDWPVDYDIDMPEGVSTRLLTLLSPATAITLSIYGHHAAGPSAESASTRFATSSALTSSEPRPSRETLEWAWEWAGGIDGLVALIAYSTDDQIKRRALDCLSLAPHTDIRSALSAHPAAVPFLLQSDLAGIYDNDPAALLLPHIASRVPHGHAAHPICSTTADRRERIAWRLLPHPLALHVLSKSRDREGLLLDSPDPPDVDAPAVSKSKLVLLVEAARAYADGSRYADLGAVLDMLDPPPTDATAQRYLARVISRLVVCSNMGNKSQRKISLDPQHARLVVEELAVVATETINGKSCLGASRALALPLLAHIDPSDPLARIFVQAPSPPDPDSNGADATITSITSIADPSARAIARLSSHLTQPRPSALVHCLSPSDLVQLVAPDLHAALATARIPPLGIPPRQTSRSCAQASDYAGKVYSSHEFRNRERERDRDGALSPPPTGSAGVAVPLAVPGFPTPMGGGGGGGNGMAGGRMSRPASRHVDDYTR